MLNLKKNKLYIYLNIINSCASNIFLYNIYNKH
jgi:hypothetical protein